jgi:hypothetical protein
MGSGGEKMKKLKYGIILLFSIIMFSIPVLAAQTYYLPSKIVGDGYYMSYSYDKYGHIKKDILSTESGLRIESKWKYKYDKNGKRVSGEMYRVENGEDRLIDKLTFDKKQYLKSSCNVAGYPGGRTETYTWNKDGYLLRRSNGTSYKYYSDRKLKAIGIDLRKRAYYSDGILLSISSYNKDGLIIKKVSKISPEITSYEYEFNKNGLVKTIIKTTINTDSGKVFIDKSNVSYSKTKTDKKTYAEFINGRDTCFFNALL